ncbi:phosphatidylserine decarboxylase [Synechococcus sp. CS-1328]|uniref:phosphatidylserine decarboxylase n=1 Tax=Synechococcus sp. CS-1328 TaxID=2847976 RepID=UPI00223A79BE|nr:phosphatidylserine decarboxylase [Synechococcus sp. CS-1328]MCT0225397.1 phosphatidylserine decarboxylase [Synechococcus sp. CS-1328]
MGRPARSSRRSAAKAALLANAALLASLLLSAAGLPLLGTITTGPAVAATPLSALRPAPTGNQRHQPVVGRLIALLQAHPELRTLVEHSLRRTGRFEEPLLPSYLAFLDRMITEIPNNRDLLPNNLDFYFVIASSPDQTLRRDPLFQAWVRDYVHTLGSFFNTVESAQLLDSFRANPLYRVEDYAENPSGWLTFNQFFARSVRPGKRPIAAPLDPRVVVAPADSTFLGAWPIQDDSRITLKGLEWNVSDLLQGSPYRDRFRGGVFTHSYLSPFNYHRFHTPVAGVVREVRTVMGALHLDVVRQADGSLGVINNDLGFVFNQERGIVVLESPLGLVAVIPVGMGVVSSVNFTAQAGARLVKGEELGYFAFGGSDVVMLFEARAAVGFQLRPGEQVLQGSPVAMSPFRP